jgi:RNA-directed DNA polymerase
MTVRDLEDHLRHHWPTIREQSLTGTYQPQPVKRVEISKPDGSMRKLGIPTVLDRFIQQALFAGFFQSMYCRLKLRLSPSIV